VSRLACFVAHRLTRRRAAATPHVLQTALVTGSNTGIGYEMAVALAAHGAHVLLASRSKSRVDAAVQKLKAAHPNAHVSGYTLDLAAFRCAAARRVAHACHMATLNGTCAAALRGLVSALRARPNNGACCAHASYATSSIDAFVQQLSDDGISALHILIDNAGVLIPPFGKVRAGCYVSNTMRVIRPHAGFTPWLNVTRAGPFAVVADGAGV
jgi:NAD(P)-dependent dehydrogenase (short-subunit alcohol dehydrogenase family)